MPKKLTAEERNKLAKEIVASSELDSDILEQLGLFKKPRDRSKNLSQKLRKYHIVVEQSVFWVSRQAYLELLKSFLEKKIGGITFCSEFLALQRQDMVKVYEISRKIEEGIKPLPDFSYISKSDGFLSKIDDLFFEIDRYSPHIEDSNWNEIVYSESKLRSVIQENYLPIFQKFCESQ